MNNLFAFKQLIEELDSALEIETHREARIELWHEKADLANPLLRLAEKQEEQVAELNACLPLSTGKTRNEAAALLGEVLRHDDGEGASHGCVEVQTARSLIDTLIGQRLVSEQRREELEAQNQTFRNAQKACEDCDAPTMAEFKALKDWKTKAQTWMVQCVEALRQSDWHELANKLELLSKE